MRQNNADMFQVVRALFPHTKNVVYFNSASYGPFSTALQEAIYNNIRIRMAADYDDSHDAFTTQEQLRSDYAQLIGAHKREIGIGLNTSFGLNIAAFGLPLQQGDEILVSDIEFPALVYTFRAAAERQGLKLQFVPSRNRFFDIDELQKKISPRSKVLAISWVQFFNGYKNDLHTLSKICREHDLYFVVDGIQGMGVEPIDVHKLGIDIFASGCQKWMLSPQGCGFFYLSDRIRNQISPPFMSWLGTDWNMKFSNLFKYDQPYFDSARRFELGYYAVLNLMGMKASVELFKQLGIHNIQQHNYQLIDRLTAYLDDSSYYTITSSRDHKHRSSIITFTCPDYRPLQKKLLAEKIIVVPREGSIRVSVHFFNNDVDIERLIHVLKEWERKHG